MVDKTQTTPEPEKFIKKYFEFPDGRKEWAVTGLLGSVSFWATEVTGKTLEIMREKYYGGVETHYNDKSKPDYLGDSGPYKNCQVNGGECWHDGTSLWASEYWIPQIMPLGQDAIWQRLIGAYHDYMKKDKSEAA